jgi:hypothetical protein
MIAEDHFTSGQRASEPTLKATSAPPAAKYRVVLILSRLIHHFVNIVNNVPSTGFPP